MLCQSQVLTEHTRELLPIVDLPTVGAFCKSHGLMFRSPPRGLYLGLQDRGELSEDPQTTTGVR